MNEGLEAAEVASPVARLQGAATGDRIFRTLLTAAALAIPVLLGFLVFELWSGSRPAIARFGTDFLTTSTWDPVADQFGALPLIFGTLLSSLIALVIAVGGQLIPDAHDEPGLTIVVRVGVGIRGSLVTVLQVCSVSRP